MGKFKIELNAEQLLYEYMCLKVKNNLGNTVTAEEFKSFTDQLLDYFNNSDRFYELNLTDNDFESVCSNLGQNQKIFNKDDFVYDDGSVEATYKLKSKSVLTVMCAKEFMRSYFEQEVSRKEYKPDYDNSKYHCSKDDYEIVAKNIAEYLVHYLMKQYIELNVKEHKWPSQCWCPNYNILDQDLAYTIHLPGTRSEFITMYIWAQMVIYEMLRTRDYFEISNNPENCLAFANFSEIVAPFKSMDFSIYNEQDFAKRHKTISIIMNNGEIILRECEYISNEDKFVYNDYKLSEIPPQFIEDVANSGQVRLHLAGTHKHFVS